MNRESSIPMWDSSDPNRAPPSLPIAPDSPNLASTGAVSGSPFKSASPSTPSLVKGRPFSSINEDRYLNILQQTADVKEQTELMSTAVKDLISSFELISQDSKDKLASLATQMASIESPSQDSNAIQSNISDILSSLEQQKSAQAAVDLTIQSLLHQSKEIFNTLQLQDAQLQKLANNKDKNPLLTAGEFERINGNQLKTIMNELENLQETKADVLKIQESLSQNNHSFAEKVDSIQFTVSSQFAKLCEIYKSNTNAISSEIIEFKSDTNVSLLEVMEAVQKATKNSESNKLIPEIHEKMLLYDQHYSDLNESVAKSLSKGFSTSDSKLAEIQLLLSELSSRSKSDDEFQKHTQVINEKLNKISQAITEEQTETFLNVETSLRSIQDTLLSDLEQSKSSLEIGTKEISGLHLKVKDLESKLEAQLSQSKLEYQNLELRLENSTKEAERNQEYVSKSNNLELELKQQKSQWNEELSLLQKENERLKHDLEVQISVSKKFEQEIASNQLLHMDKVTDLESKISILVEKADIAERSNEEKVNSIQNMLNTKQKESEKNTKNLEAQLEQLKQNFGDTQLALTAELKVQSDSHIKALHEISEKASTSNLELVESKALVEKQKSEISSINLEHKLQKENLESKLSSYVDKHNLLNDTIGSLKEELKNLKQTLDRKEQDLVSLESKNRDIEDLVRVKESSILQLKSELDKMELNIEKLTQETKLLSSVKEESLQSITKELDYTKAQLLSTEQSLESLKLKNEDSTQKHNNIVASLEDSIAKLTKDMEAMTKKHEISTSSEAEKQRSLENELSEVKRQLSVSQLATEELNTQLDLKTREFLMEKKSYELTHKSLTDELSEVREKKSTLEFQVKELELRLEGQLKDHKLQIETLESQSKINLDDAENKVQTVKRDMKLLKYLNLDIEKHEATISALENQSIEFKNLNVQLEKQLSQIESSYKTKLDELQQLEARIDAFERRLAESLLERSKSILGTATLSIINSGDKAFSSNSPVQPNNSSPRRHLSVTPKLFGNMETEEKENEIITVAKRATTQKLRSVSLFVKEG